jgi:hypothetical protein
MHKVLNGCIEVALLSTLNSIAVLKLEGTATRHRQDQHLKATSVAARATATEVMVLTPRANCSQLKGLHGCPKASR